jgi:hypothetical protein
MKSKIDPLCNNAATSELVYYVQLCTKKKWKWEKVLLFHFHHLDRVHRQKFQLTLNENAFKLDEDVESETKRLFLNYFHFYISTKNSLDH